MGNPHLRKRDLVILSLYGLTLSLAANTLDPPVYTAKVNQIVTDARWRNATLGLITFAGLVVAALVQPMWGALSDRATTRWGRRLPFLVGGSVVNIFLFALLAFAGDVWSLGIMVLFIQLSSNAVQGAFQGLIPDQVPLTQHGVAAGIKSLAEFPAVILGPLMAGLILGIGGWAVTSKVLVAMGVLQAVFVGVTALTVWHSRKWTRQRASPSQREVNRAGIWQAIRDTFRIDWRTNRDLGWWLVNRFLFWSALLMLRSFLINYVEIAIGLSPEQAQRITGLIGALLGILIFLVVLPSGYLSDRVGRRPLLMVAGVIAAAGALVFLAARSIPMMVGAGVLIGLGGGFFITSSWALATALAPREGAARYMGITNLATAGGSAFARLAGPLIDGLNRLFDSDLAGYVGVYALSGVLFLLSSWAIRHVSRR